MISKKNIITVAIVASLMTGISSVAEANTTNNLLQMDVKKSSATADTVDVTFYTTGDSTNSIVSRKSNNRYVVLLPNVSGSSSVTPGIGGVKDLISDVDVKHVDDGIGGYMKVTFGTTKPVNIRTYVKKTAPLTQAQKDYKALIAQNIKPTAQTAQQPKKTTTPQPAVNKQPAQKVVSHPVAQTKPANNTKTNTTNTNTNTTKTAPKTETKSITLPKISLTPITPPKVKVEQPKPRTEQPKVTPKAQTVTKPVQIPHQEKVVNSAVHPVDNYVPKMKFDANGKRQIDLEPRINHEIAKNTSVNKPNEVENLAPQNDNNIQEAPIANAQTESTAQNVDNTNTNQGHHIPLWMILAGGFGVFAVAMFLVFDAVSHASQKNTDRLKSFFTVSATNQMKRKRKEYQDIIDDENLNWQEKYKKYSEKDKQHNPVKPSQDMSYVTDMSATKKAIITLDMNIPSKSVPTLNSRHQMNSIPNIQSRNTNDVREKLQAQISQMEHSLSQTPNVEPPEDVITGVHSEDDTIMNKFSDIKLKSFAKSVNLKQTHRTLLDEEDKQTRNKSFKEGRFVKLKNSPLSVNKRESASSQLEVSDVMDSGRKYLTNNNNGEMKMDKQNENYLLSSLDEYLSILDSEDTKQTSTVAESLSRVRPETNVMSRSGITNPISRGSNPMAKSNTHYMNGLIVKSGYNINSEKGFYLVNMDGVSALVGRIKDDIFILKKFDHVVDKQLQVRQDYGTVYIVKVGGFKCLVDVAKDKMGTLIEI